MEPNYWDPPYVQWVVKATKFCNLRCRYCYEYEQLANQRKMSIDEAASMFTNIASYYAGRGKKMDFVWHGGEPLSIPISHYRNIFRVQEEILAAHSISYTNTIQTNLTLLNDESLAAFKEGLFAQIGVSVDVFGDQRLTESGVQAQDRVLRNMQRLEDAGVDYGCITVLSQANLGRLGDIYTFFEDIDRSFRVLPIYRTSFAGQHDANSVSNAEILSAYKLLFERWLSSDSYIQVRPIQDYITNVIRHIERERLERRCYQKEGGEIVYIVDTDGGLYSNADAYDPDFCYGNLFEQPLGDLFAGAGYRRSLVAAERRLQEACSGCDFFGACSGYYLAEATPEQRSLDAQGRHRCEVIRPFLQYVEARLHELNLVEAMREPEVPDHPLALYEG
ncbi:MAG: hypothetical protein RLZZ219_1354 [Cyanobacteriota bacterium]